MGRDMLTIEDIEDYILKQGSDDLPTFGGTFEGGIHLQQVPDEFAACLHAILASDQRIAAYLEIGAAAGGTAYLVHHFLAPERMVLVDDNGHGKARLRQLVLMGVPHQAIIGRSQDEEVQDTVDALAPFDLVLIDGDHTYQAVKQDVLHYAPLLRPGGFLALHDSVVPGCGVAQIVQELQAYKSFDLVGEYISPTHPRPCGVALFRWMGA